MVCSRRPWQVTEAEIAVWMEAEAGCTILDAIDDARMDYNRRDSMEETPLEDIDNSKNGQYILRGFCTSCSIATWHPLLDFDIILLVTPLAARSDSSSIATPRSI